MEADISGEFPCSSIAVDSVLRIGTAGLIWGGLTGPLDADKQGLTGLARAPFIARSIGRLGFQWGLFAAVFSFTHCGVQRYRRKADLVNVLTASVVAGTVIGGTRQWKQVAGITGLVCLLYGANDGSRSI
nr:outer envelope pore protein 16-4, chloroplastic [Ipomoea batatas]